MASLTLPPESRSPANYTNCPSRIASPPIDTSSMGAGFLIPE
jgi:hypothetical protein